MTLRAFTKRLGRNFSLLLALSVLVSGGPKFAELKDENSGFRRELSSYFPRRLPGSLSGSQFIRNTKNLSLAAREQLIVREILRGNVPSFCRLLIPIHLKFRVNSIRILRGIVWVSPQYLALGSDDDFVFIPMNLISAIHISERFGFILPTKKLVDTVYEQSEFQLKPYPLRSGPQMVGNNYFQRHSDEVRMQMRSIRLSGLTSGYKKDLVLSNIIGRGGGRLAIYGWHRSKANPVQPLSTAHHALYVDYSHGLRIVSGTMMVGDRLMPVVKVLQDLSLSKLLSDEGTIKKIQTLIFMP